jgi:hypothetical protein
MAQKTSWNGAALTESDINLYLGGEGGAWSSWSPTIDQGGNVTRTVSRGAYGRWGRLIMGDCVLAVTGTGTAATTIIIAGLPANIASSNTNTLCGDAYVYDQSANAFYYGAIHRYSATQFEIVRRVDGSAVLPLGASGFTAALAVNDVITLTFAYEAAT